MIPYFYNKITIAYGLALSASAFAFAFYFGFYMRAAYANKSILPDSQIELVPVVLLYMFVLVSGAVALLLLRRMQKAPGSHQETSGGHPDFGNCRRWRAQHLGVILILGIAGGGALNIVSS